MEKENPIIKEATKPLNKAKYRTYKRCKKCQSKEFQDNYNYPYGQESKGVRRVICNHCGHNEYEVKGEIINDD